MDKGLALAITPELLAIILTTDPSIAIDRLIESLSSIGSFFNCSITVLKILRTALTSLTSNAIAIASAISFGFILYLFSWTYLIINSFSGIFLTASKDSSTITSMLRLSVRALKIRS